MFRTILLLSTMLALTMSGCAPSQGPRSSGIPPQFSGYNNQNGGA